MTKFKELRVGDTFDFVSPELIGYNSFFKRCIKTGSRTYRTLEQPPTSFRVGSNQCAVFHVENKGVEPVGEPTQ